MALSLISIVLMFFLAHFLVYYYIVILFWITKYKIVILLTFFILSLSFILSSLFVHFYNNILVRDYYYISSLWLGLLLNLLTLIIILTFILIIFKIFHINVSLKIIWICLLSIAVIITWYGLYNASNPIIKNVDITIKNLPENWKHKKIIFLSDVHLWAILREKYLQKIVKMINSEKPDIVFISWDLLDWTDWSLDHLPDYINTIKAPIYYVNGNHETYIWMIEVEKILSKTKIKELKDEFVSVDWVQIVWISYTDERNWNSNLNSTFKKLEESWFKKDKPSILLYHVPLYTEEFKIFWINLQLSGHSHKWQIWPYWYITSLIYGWKDYWLYTKNNYNLYTSNWVWTWWPPIRTWNTPEIVVLNLK
jgi:predicted MPP superfamily phosphohydrolase